VLLHPAVQNYVHLRPSRRAKQTKQKPSRPKRERREPLHARATSGLVERESGCRRNDCSYSLIIELLSLLTSAIEAARQSTFCIVASLLLCKSWGSRQSKAQRVFPHCDFCDQRRGDHARHDHHDRRPPKQWRRRRRRRVSTCDRRILAHWRQAKAPRVGAPTPNTDTAVPRPLGASKDVRRVH
jgi:hypothetical protein